MPRVPDLFPHCRLGIKLLDSESPETKAALMPPQKGAYYD